MKQVDAERFRALCTHLRVLRTHFQCPEDVYLTLLRRTDVPYVVTKSLGVPKRRTVCRYEKVFLNIRVKISLGHVRQKL